MFALERKGRDSAIKGMSILPLHSERSPKIGLDISHYLDLLPTYHMCPLGAWRDTCELYWKAGWSRDNTGSCKNKLDICMYYAPLVLACPTTPRPRTVSRVPDREKIRQLRSLSCTVASPRFSSLMQYRHQYTLFC